MLKNKQSLLGPSDPRSFSNDDGDGSEDVKKAIGLLGKTTTVHVHHAILYISFINVRPCTTMTWKCLIASFMEDVKKGRRISFSLSLKLSALLKLTPGKFAYTCHFQQIRINATKFEKTGIHFKFDVFAVVAVVDAKAEAWG